MTKKGKRLLIIVSSVIVVIFLGLYLYAELSAPNHNKFATARKNTAKTAASAAKTMDPILTEDADESLVRPLPSVRLSRTLQKMAYGRYVSNRIREAIDIWEISLYLNESNYLSRRRLEDVKKQLDSVVLEIIALGNMDYQNLRYKRAIYHWEKVLNLLRDKESPEYKQTEEKILLAKRKLRR